MIRLPMIEDFRGQSCYCKFLSPGTTSEIARNALRIERLWILRNKRFARVDVLEKVTLKVIDILLVALKLM